MNSISFDIFFWQIEIALSKASEVLTSSSQPILNTNDSPTLNLTTTPVTPAQTYQMLQLLTERLESNLKNALQRHHVNTHKKKRVKIPRV